MRQPGERALVLQGVPIVRRLQLVSHKPVTPLAGAELRVLEVVPQAPEKIRHSGSTLSKIRHRLGSSLVKCRPATLKRLKEDLELARQNHAPFGVVHFEGHGSFHQGGGVLYFEAERAGALEPVDVEQLRQAVQEVPLVVLDACQASDTGGPGPSWDAVAPQLLRENVQCVIAAPYSVHVDQMAVFAPKLYEELLAGRTLCEAVSAGRDALMMDRKRRTSPGTSESVGLLDWWTIQLYQQGEDLSLIETRHSRTARPMEQNSHLRPLRSNQP